MHEGVLRRGAYIATVAPNSYLGPVLAVVHSATFTTINVPNGWIDIWTSEGGGVYYAREVARREVLSWFCQAGCTEMVRAPCG